MDIKSQGRAANHSLQQGDSPRPEVRRLFRIQDTSGRVEFMRCSRSDQLTGKSTIQCPESLASN
jgi:hypothetical protein